MVEALVLRVEPEPGGAWWVSLGHPRLQPSRGRLEASDVAQLVADVRQELAPERLPAVLRPDMDARFSRREGVVGQALARALHASTALTMATAEARERARQRGVPLAVLIDAHGEARSLPWELLADAPDGPGLEAVGKGIVARVAAGQLPSPRSGPWAVHVRRTDDDDPMVETMARGVEASAARGGLPLTSDAAPDGTRRMLCLIGHGERDASELALLVKGAEVAPSTAVHALGPWASSDLALLSVCEGGMISDGKVPSLVDLLVYAGGRAVLAPTGRVSVEAARVIASALLSALAAGKPTVLAAAEARRALRAQALATPESRWYRWLLHVGDLGLIEDEGGPGRPDWERLGWPVLGADAGALIHRAERLSVELQSGFLGAEHMAIALADGPPVPGLVRPRLQLQPLRERLRRQAQAYEPLRAGTCAPTPRMRALAAALSSGDSVLKLWKALHGSAVWEMIFGLSPRLLAPNSTERGNTTRPVSGQRTAGAPLVDDDLLFEVLSGPEDGRIFTLRRGEVFGRYAPDGRADMTLYRNSLVTDPSLSRAHLRALGAGRLHVHARVRLHRAGVASTSLTGEIRLCAGDLLELTPLTWLLVGAD